MFRNHKNRTKRDSQIVRLDRAAAVQSCAVEEDQWSVPSTLPLSKPSPTSSLEQPPLVLSPKASEQSKNRTRPISIQGRRIGGSELTVVAGPSYVETAAQMAAVGGALQKLSVPFLRSRAFRQEAWHTEFQGLGGLGLRLLRATAERFQLAVISEMTDLSQLKSMLEYCDVIEVGSRNAHNYTWLRELSYTHTTVLLHRGPLMTVNDFQAAIRQLEQGKRAKIILAENGIRAFDPRLKNMLDLSSIIHFRRETPHPMLVDCGAAASDKRFVEALAIAAISAGADGIMAELHPSPQDSFVETKTAFLPEEFRPMMGRLRAMKYTLNALTLDLNLGRS